VKKIEFKFSEKLHECILDGLEYILGEIAMKAVIFYIELGDCIEDPSEFHKNLYAIFGEGTLILEKTIVKELFRRLNLSCEERSDFDFARCVNEAEEHFLARQKTAQLELSEKRIIWAPEKANFPLRDL
jgi:hypothetical protein